MIFDSDAMIWLGRGDPAVSAIFESDPRPGLSLVTLIELYQGSRSALELRTTRSFVNRLEIRRLPVTEAISYRAVALIERHAKGDGLQLGDALIAATALEHDETLLTGNVRHFRAIRGLKLKPFRHSGVH
jgi:predicted nucleic acid-binding protein